MSDLPSNMILGHAYIRPLSSELPTDWIGIGTIGTTAEGLLFEPWPASVPGISTDPLDRDRHRSGLPGDERCDAMGVQERTVGDRFSRLVTPCWLRPDHGGDVHEGVAGTWRK